jgi:hypothetical protein
MNITYFIGQKTTYYGKNVTVIDKNSSHVLIQFESGSKLCTSRGFKN